LGFLSGEIRFQEKIGVSKKSNRDYVMAELRDLDDNKVKIRTLLVDNIASNHLK